MLQNFKQCDDGKARHFYFLLYGGVFILKKISLTVLILIALLLTISAAAADDTQINITYVGFNPSNPSYDSGNIEVLTELYVEDGSVPENYNVNYKYICGYGDDFSSASPELKEFVSDSGTLSEQDIVIFDMIFLSDIEDIYGSLKSAKSENENLKLVQIRGIENETFDVNDDPELISLISSSFTIPTRDRDGYKAEGRSLSILFISHLLNEYAPPEKIENIHFTKTNVLYVGYDIGEQGVRYSGTYGFNSLASNLNKTFFSGYFGELKSVSYGTAPDYSPYIYPITGDWYSVNNLKSNMTASQIKFEDFDIVIFDGFFSDDMLSDFADIFDEANDAGAKIIFNSAYGAEKSTQNISFNRNTVSPNDYTLRNYPDYIMPLPTESGTASLNYDQPLTSNGKGALSSLLNISQKYGTGLTQELFVPGQGFLTLPDGSLFHPSTGDYFKTFEDYDNWYRSSGRYHEGKPYIGIVGFDVVYLSQMKELTQILEEKGYNVVAGGDTGFVYDNLDTAFAKKIENGDGLEYESYVACLISLKNWAMNYGNQLEGVSQMENLNVPVIKVVASSGWGDADGYDKNSGIPASTFTWMASSSNVDGMLDFIGYNDENKEWIADRAIAWADLNTTANADKDIAILYYNYPPGKSEIGANYLNVMRSLAGDGAKDRVAAGDSTVEIKDPVYGGILRELRDEEGYKVDVSKLPVVTITEGGVYEFNYEETNESLILNEENLIRLIYAQGINVGSYAPGVLDDMVQQRIDFINDGGDPDDWWGCELIPVKDYLEWLEHETTSKEEGGNGTMDKALYDSLVETWGLPTADGPVPADNSSDAAWGGMIWHDADGEINPHAPGMNYLIIPMIKFGDVRIMPQPNRALASDKALDSATYHSGDLPPTHQYVAFYFWLNRGTGDSTGSGETGLYGGDNWKADAVVHFGTHGTQEWLPGTSVGLYRTHDWGPVLLPDLPNIYPYIVANVGEGLTAEYRGNALIISHLTPPMIKTRLYDDIIDMETAIRGYQKQDASAGGNPAILSAYREIIMETVFQLGWQDAFKTQFDVYKKEIADEKYKGKINSVTDEDLQKYLVENKDVFDVFLEDHLHNFVEAVRETSLSYGTHTYGTFNEDQVAPMVWNMWSRQGFDDVLLDTYFDDVSAIPTTNDIDLGIGLPEFDKSDISSKYDEDDILEFVEKVVSRHGTPTADNIRADLQAVFTQEESLSAEERAAKEDKVIYFLLGPSAYMTDSRYSGNANAVVEAWKETKIDGVSIYETLTDELFEFYFYFEIPESLVNESGTGTYRASSGDYLDDAKLESAIIAFVAEVGTDANYQSVEKALAKEIRMDNNFGRSWYNDRMVYHILGNNRIAYAENLRSCGDSEMNALISALSGGYISPSSGNDPVLNPHVLPTGRNFYGVDPSTYSTPAAWKVGKVMGEQMLIDYYNKYNEFPSTVSFMRFGVDYIQDEGTLEAALFYLLGCEPTWTSTGTFAGAKPVVAGDSNYDDMFKLTFKNNKGKTVELYRPRVDIVYNSAGMRDGYGSMLREIDKAVKAVAKLDESADNPKVTNNIKKNVKELSEILKGSGLSEDEIWELATSRVFAQELGNYEIGTGNLISASGKMDPNDPESLKAIADMYLAKMGYLYTENNWGESSDQITKMLQALLGRTDASLFASAGNLYDSLDNDDVYQYFGAMNMVSSMYDKDGNYISDPTQWKTPEMYIADTSNIHNYKNGDKVVYTAREYIQKDLAARYLNDEWIQGQMEAGYSGAMLFSELMENLYGWAVVTNGDIIGQETWNQIYEKYFSENSSVNQWMSQSSEYAQQSSNARLLEAVRMGYFDASNEQISQLLENYVQSVLDSSLACCHHTCGNPALDEFIAGQMSVLGLTAEEQEKYWEIVKQATDRDKPSIKVDDGNKNQSSSSGGGYGSASVEAGDAAGGESGEEGEESDEGNQNPGVGMEGTETGTPVNEVSGFEMTVTNMANSVRDFIQNPTFSTSSMIAIAFVILVVGAIFYGSRRKNL